ncbi:MAG: sigma-70 family RNA polymerase sigma factor [Bacilli bacterium]|nr:sigma-70 family RNA polymerase sigma factor [Bacilli bacterium]
MSYVNDFNLTIKNYYKNLRNLKPLSKEEERKLLVMAKNNNIEAQNKIIESNLKFVFDVAKNYKGYGVPLEDLISEGNIGLIKAIKKFDMSHDVKFISYAVWWIRYHITAFIKKKWESAEKECSDQELYSKNDRDCDIYDMEDENVLTIDVILSSEKEEDEKEMAREKHKFVNELLEGLDDRSRKIVEMYYGLNGYEEMNLEEISNILLISKERVRQICKKSISQFRNEIMLKNKLNYSY